MGIDPMKSSSKSNYAILVVSLLAIFSAMLRSELAWLHYITKPLATLLILLLAAKANPAVSPRYRKLVCAGMFLGLFGDVFLMLPGNYFVPGLVAFLLGHLCYVAALFPGSAWTARIVAFAAYLGIAAANLVFLLPKLPHALVVPVLAYIGVLMLMAALAAARAWALRDDINGFARPAKLAAIGAVLFVCSDSLLAWNKFGVAGGIPLAMVWILGTYYAAQWLIARSVQRQ